MGVLGYIVLDYLAWRLILINNDFWNIVGGFFHDISSGDEGNNIGIISKRNEK